VMTPNEPQLDRVVADIYAGADTASSVRTFVQPASAHGGPGAGTLMSRVGPYYAYTRGPKFDLDPENANLWDRKVLPLPNLTEAPNLIGYSVKNNPKVTKIVMWKPFYATPGLAQDEDIAPPPADAPDPILKRLGQDWKLDREELFPVRYHWSWGELYLYRRREYVKSIGATSRPAPTTRATS